MTTSATAYAENGHGRGARWIALCYHDVQPQIPPGGSGPARFTSSLSGFECMLDTIARNGLIGCSLADAVRAPDERNIAITFDDGNVGQYEHAFPALLARGMNATFYVTTNWVGEPGYISWGQLREMAAAGMSIQSHTVSHPFLSELTATQLENELGQSKARIDRELQQDTTEIAFPGGDAPAPGLHHLIDRVGYRVAVGSRWGTNRGSGTNGFLHRCTMRGELTAEEAELVLRCDRWLRLRWTAKEATLRRIRTTLGASRYTRWRRVFLNTIKVN